MNDITYTTCQEELLNKFTQFYSDPNEKVMVIEGFAGTGKTFMLKKIAEAIPALDNFNAAMDITTKTYTPHFCATTNKAVQQLSTHIDGVSTIFNKLGLYLKIDYRTGLKKLHTKIQGSSLGPNTVLFIDESSMISRELYDHITNHSIPKVVYIGDRYQLSPVKEGMSAAFSSTENYARLSTVVRQEENHPIKEYCNHIREAIDNPEYELPPLPDDPRIKLYDHVQDFQTAIKRHYITTPTKDCINTRILAWANNTVEAYNRIVQTALGQEDLLVPGQLVINNNPSNRILRFSPLMFHKKSTFSVDTIFNVVDKKATYNINVGNNKINEQVGGQVVILEHENTWFEVIVPVEKENYKAVVSRLARAKAYGKYYDLKEKWANLRPIYASTVHKAQGSTFKDVFVDMMDIYRCRNRDDRLRLLYVALSRTSQNLHILGM